MISVHCPMRKPQLSSIKRLVEYITDKQNKEHRIVNVRITNCADDKDIKTAITHMQDVQILNRTRCLKHAKGETTYHLILSFKDEYIPIEVLDALEDRVCEALGYEEHQRVSAVHTDTDNLHIHIAINKIHPKTHNIHDPLRDYQILARTCIELEQEYGLKPDNHIAKNSVNHAFVKNIEAKTGLKSLLTYIEQNCLDELKNATNWQELHQILAKNALEIKARGGGLVIVAKNQDGNYIKGAHIKASTVGRWASKTKLEAKLGIFEAYQINLSQIKAINFYQTEPITKIPPQDKELNNLWQKFINPITNKNSSDLPKNNCKSWLNFLQHEALKGNSYALELLRKRKHKPILDNLNGLNAKDYKQTEQEEKKAELIRLIKRTVTIIHYCNIGRIDPINKKPTLEYQNKFKHEFIELTNQINSSYADSENKRILDQNIYIAPIDGITKNGTIIYRSKTGTIKDDGVNCTINSQDNKLDTKKITHLIDFISKKRGRYIDVKGDEVFKRKTIWATVKHRIGGFFFRDEEIAKKQKQLMADVITGKTSVYEAIKWADDELPKRQYPKYITIDLEKTNNAICSRLAYLNQITAQAKKEKEQHPNSQKFTNLKQLERDNLDDQFRFKQRPSAEYRTNRANSAITKIALYQPNTRINGYIKTSITKYGVPNVSKCRMDDWRNRSEMFLHTDSSLYMDKCDASRNNVLRWDAEIARYEQQKLAAIKAEQMRRAEQARRENVIAKQQAEQAKLLAERQRIQSEFISPPSPDPQKPKRRGR